MTSVMKSSTEVLDESRVGKVLDVRNLPISLAKVLALIHNIIMAVRVSGDSSARLALTGKSAPVPNPVCSGPITAESSVDDVEVLVEELVRIACVRFEDSHGFAPGVRVGVTGVYVGGDGVSGEPPYGYTAVLGPHHGINTATDGIERSSVRIIVGQISTTASLVGSLV